MRQLRSCVDAAWSKNRELVKVDGAAAERGSARRDPNTGDSIRLTRYLEFKQRNKETD